MKTLFLDSGQGVLPFIFEILKQKKKNDYIFYLDEVNFPYGNKNKEEVKLILKNHLQSFQKIQDLDKVFIACNTLSTLLDKNERYPFLIDNILDVNLSLMDHDAYYLGTKITANFLKNKGIKTLAMPALASYIEKKDIKNIIKIVKNEHLPKKIVLGCTHYPLIKFLFLKYSKSEVFSYEKEYISSINDDDKDLHLTLYTNKKELYKKILLIKDINFLPLT